MTFIYKLCSLSLLFALIGCDKQKEILAGDREEVFKHAPLIKSELTRSIVVNAAVPTNWPMAGGNAAHNPPVLSVTPAIKEAWRFSMGHGSNSDARLLNGPIIADNTVFAMDAGGDINALNLETGALLWTLKTQLKDQHSQPFGGGLAYDSGKIFAVTAAAEVVAVNAKTGTVVWRQSVSAPIRSTPTITNHRVYVISINNQLDVFDCETGQLLWSQTGIMENAGILGGSSVAVKDGVVVVPYSSGEVFGLRQDTGAILWSDSLAALKAVDSVSGLAHIKARPLIHQNKTLVISHSGRMSLYHLRTGQTLWSKEIGGIRSPALSEDTVFLVDNNNHLLALDFESGRIIWSKQLPLTRDLKEKGDRLLWAGPILTSNYLILAGSNGKIIFCSPKDGTIEHVIDNGSSFLLSPIGSGNTLILMSDQGDVIAYK